MPSIGVYRLPERQLQRETMPPVLARSGRSGPTKPNASIKPSLPLVEFHPELFAKNLHSLGCYQ
jgi:hypothetical protein